MLVVASMQIFFVTMTQQLHYKEDAMTQTSPLKHDRCCARCEEQIVAATRELGAFVMAIGALFGKVEAARATEYWILLAESQEGPFADGYPDWRQITVAAASRLASDAY
jgi:hypothetical protein